MTLAKRTHIFYLLLSVLSLISLICIGFSSWTIAGEVSLTLGGGMTASPVLDHSDYFEFGRDEDGNTAVFECFEFYDGGFTLDDYTATITVHYAIKVKNCVDEFKCSAQLPITVYFRGVTATGGVFPLIGSEDSTTTEALKIDDVEFFVYGQEYEKTPTITVEETQCYATILFDSSIFADADDISEDDRYYFSVQFSVSYNGEFSSLYPLLVDSPGTENEKYSSFFSHARMG